MKLTKKILDKLIQEEMSKVKNQKFKSDYEREQHKRSQQKEAEERRKAEKAIRPDYDLMKLARGVLQEGELIAEPTDDGYVKIKEDALKRMLSENNSNVQELCNKNRYFQLDQILDFISKLKQADKGKI